MLRILIHYHRTLCVDKSFFGGVIVKKNLKILLIFLFVSGCDGIGVDKLKQSSMSFFKSNDSSQFEVLQNYNNEIKKQTIQQLLAGAEAKVNIEGSFGESLKSAVEKDPGVITISRELLAMKASVDVTKSQKEFQVSGTLYGGIEDVSDNSKGIAMVLSANRLIFDGGALDAQIATQNFSVKSKEYALRAKIDERLMELASIWVELERYETLNKKIEDRVGVLGPLISKLEQVAEAGLGDVRQVAAAQRTVTKIQVTQADIAEKFEAAKVNFVNSFGSLPQGQRFDHELVLRLMPEVVTKEMANQAAAIQMRYADYMAAEANLQSVLVRDGIKLGFESRVTRPFGASTRDSDESIGFALRKTLFNGKKNISEIEQAKAQIDANIAKLNSSYREGVRVIKNAQQNVSSMKEAVELARKNAQIASDEIVYLRKQLVIGGSTLDSVLSAEARLYEAEANEINFEAEKRKSELSILNGLSLLGPAIGIAYEMN